MTTWLLHPTPDNILRFNVGAINVRKWPRVSRTSWTAYVWTWGNAYTPWVCGFGRSHWGHRRQAESCEQYPSTSNDVMMWILNNFIRGPFPSFRCYPEILHFLRTLQLILLLSFQTGMFLLGFFGGEARSYRSMAHPSSTPTFGWRTKHPDNYICVRVILRKLRTTKPGSVNRLSLQR
jgi:hypothetical protein